MHVTTSAVRRLLIGGLFALGSACGDPAAPIPVASVVVTPANQTLHSLGESLQLSVVAKDADGNAIEGRTVTWTSDAPGILAIADGIAEAKAPGEANVTATVDGIAGSAKLTVEQAVATIEMTPATMTLTSLTETERFTARPKDARGNLVEGKVLAWSSSAPGVVAANTSGGVMAVANGQSTITAAVDGVSATGTVTVAQVPAKLAFASTPVTTQNGVAMPAVNVEIRDALGSRVAGATSQVSIALGANAGGATLSGTVAATASNGVASFFTLAIDKPGLGYTLSATSSDLTAATSSAFEIMDVPMRIDSVKFASTNVKIGGSVAYSLFITNGSGKNATLVGVQNYIVQGNGSNAAGGASAFGCGSPTAGTVAPGSCRIDWGVYANTGTFAAGAATAKIELREGQAQTLRGTKLVAVTMVP